MRLAGNSDDNRFKKQYQVYRDKHYFILCRVYMHAFYELQYGFIFGRSTDNG